MSDVGRGAAYSWMVEGLDPLFIFPVFDGLEVVLGYTGLHGVLGGLILRSHMKVSGPIQNTFWAQGVVSDSSCEVQLLAWRHETACHGDQWPGHMHLGVHDGPKPLARVIQGDEMDMPQLLGLPALVWAMGYNGRMRQAETWRHM